MVAQEHHLEKVNGKNTQFVQLVAFTGSMFSLSESRGVHQELLLKIWKQIEVYGKIILSPFCPRRGIVVIKMPFGAFFLFLTVVGIIDL